MKKLLLALVLGLLLVAGVATIALADNGPHGGFNGSTDACASCHRAHSAVSADGFLLVAGDVYSLCTSCHDGTGAYTNVVDGFYDTQVGDPGKAAFAGGWGDANTGLFGGGFVNTRMLTDYGNASNETGPGLAQPTNNAGADMNNSIYSWARWNKYDTTSTVTSRAVTSTHTVAGLGGSVGTGTVWGSGDFNSVNVVFTGATALECTSCHDPHGNAGRGGGLPTGVPYPSYRLLRFTPQGSSGFTIASEVGTTGYWDTDMPWVGGLTGYAAGLLSGPAVPSAAGVFVPDPTTKWYTVNNLIAQDPAVGAYSGRSASGPMVAIFAGAGDYMGRYYGYRRPATTAVGGSTDCPTIIANPTNGTPPNAPSATGANACGAATGTAFNNTPSHDTLGFWCSTCHDRYLAPGGASRTTDSGDTLYHYRHRSQGLSNTSFGRGQYDCVDCHNAHGTSATADALASAASYGTGSVLLKGDNRAICTRCHAASVNFFNVTTSPNFPNTVIP